MAAPTTIQHGATVALLINDQALASRMGCTLTEDFQVQDTSDADGNFFTDSEYTLKAWNVTGNNWFLIDEKKYRGRTFVLEVDTTGSGDWEEIVCRTAMTATFNLGLLQTTSSCAVDSYVTYIPDKRSITGNVTVMMSDVEDPAKEAIKHLYDETQLSTKVIMRLRSTVTNGPTITGNAVITTIPQTFDYDQPTSWQINWQSAGEWAYTGGADLDDALADIFAAYFSAPSSTVAVRVASDVAEATIKHGTCYVAGITLNMPHEQQIQVDLQLTGTGPLSVDQNPVS